MVLHCKIFPIISTTSTEILWDLVNIEFSYVFSCLDDEACVIVACHQQLNYWNERYSEKLNFPTLRYFSNHQPVATNSFLPFLVVLPVCPGIPQLALMKEKANKSPSLPLIVYWSRNVCSYIYHWGQKGKIAPKFFSWCILPYCTRPKIYLLSNWSVDRINPMFSNHSGTTY